MKKKCQLLFLGPHIVGAFQNGPISKIFNNFLYKSKLKGSPFYDKNCQLMYLGLHNAGHFEKMGVSANWPKIDQF